jgi:hypothetical protein
MAAGMTSATVRFRNAFAVMAAASVAAALMLPTSSLAEAPVPRTSALTPLEQELRGTSDQEPSESRQPALGYLRHTDEGWKLDMLPGAVSRTGPLPLLTSTSDAAPEYPPSLSVYPYAPLFRVDF